MPTLRSYQQQALHALRMAREEAPLEQRQAIEMATGLGKTITFAVEADHALDEGVVRVLILAHTEELCDQAETKVRLMAPDRTVGVVKASRNETTADIVIGSRDTLKNPARRRDLTGVGLVIVDEAHHAVAPSYGSILEHYGATPGMLNLYPFAPGLGIPATGYSATLERTDGTPLGSVWQNIAFSRGISWAVRKGFLVEPIGYQVSVPELGAVADASKEAVDMALVDSIAPARVVEAWAERTVSRCAECLEAMSVVGSDAGHPVVPSYCPNEGCGTMDRPPSTMLFAPLVRSARAFADAFNAAGVSAAVVWGDMPAEDRKATLKAYEHGDITVLCNAMLLTEGVDIPRTKCVIWARPTRSRPLFIQGVGRGLRPWLDPEAPPREEQKCILLVVADSTPGLTTIADLSERPLEAEDGKGLLALEDEWDLSQDLLPDEDRPYDGKVHVSEFDPLVARSSKVWGTTAGGTLFVPSGFGGYVFVAPDNPGYAVAFVDAKGGKREHRRVPDLELAMGLGEDLAQDRGGNLARLVADKGRAWRKGVPTDDQKARAVRMGLDRELARIMATKTSGKAGKLSDVMDRVRASQLVDPVVEKIKQRTGR